MKQYEIVGVTPMDGFYNDETILKQVKGQMLTEDDVAGLTHWLDNDTYGGVVKGITFFELKLKEIKKKKTVVKKEDVKITLVKPKRKK